MSFLDGIEESFQTALNLSMDNDRVGVEEGVLSGSILEGNEDQSLSLFVNDEKGEDEKGHPKQEEDKDKDGFNVNSFDLFQEDKDQGEEEEEESDYLIPETPEGSGQPRTLECVNETEESVREVISSSVSQSASQENDKVTKTPEPKEEIQEPENMQMVQNASRFQFKRRPELTVDFVSSVDKNITSGEMARRPMDIVASTPLLNTRRKINVFEDLDVTGIDPAASSPIAPSPRKLNMFGGRAGAKSTDSQDTEILEVGAGSSDSSNASGKAKSPSVQFLGSVTRNSDIGISSEEEDEDIYHPSDDEDEDSRKKVLPRAAAQQPPARSKPHQDLEEVMERLKKQHIGKKPLVKYLEEPPRPKENPFASNAVRKLREAQYISEFRGDVYSCLESLSKTIEEMHAVEESEFRKPKGLKVELYPHQTVGFKWMCWREQQYPGGGILADEMGLGKTLMAIALILAGRQIETKDKENWFSPENKHLVPSSGTLVVCPVGCIKQWESEIKDKSRGLRVALHYGTNRTKSAALLAQNDVVLTTYPTMSSEIPKPEDDPGNKCRSPILRVHWARIILDEGHVIRNPKTHAALSACRLSSSYRWIITGTPVHNRAEDFYSMVRFLRLDPFSDHKAWDHWIGSKVLAPGGQDRLNTLGKALLLQRTKVEVQAQSSDPEVKLTPKTIQDIAVDLSPAELEVYVYLFDYAKSVMKNFLNNRDNRLDELQRAADQYVAGGGKRKEKQNAESYSHVLVLITRLRQMAILPFLIKTMLENDDDGEEDEDTSYNAISARNPIFEPGYKSTKIKAMMKELNTLRDEAQAAGRRMDKVIIASTWTSFLDIFACHLKRKGYTYAQLDGRLNVDERRDIVERLNNNPKGPQILLLSINAGGVGLNLVGANHMFLVEPQWNPQIERQAIDRIHRFGQTKPVFIKRFIANASVEPVLLAIQQVKLELADGLLEGSKKKKGTGLSLDDLKKIFKL